MKPDPKKKKRENPYLSAAEIEEREEFEKRNFRIKLMIIAGIPAVIALVYLIYTFSSPVGRSD